MSFPLVSPLAANNRMTGATPGKLAVALSLIAADVAFFFANSLLRSHWLPGLLTFFVRRDGGTYSTAVDRYPVFAAVMLLVFLLSGRYTQRRIFWEDVRLLAGLCILAFVLDAALFSVQPSPPAIGSVAFYWLAVLVAFPLYRIGVRAGLTALGLWRIPTVVVGSGENVEQTVLALRQHESLGFCVSQVLVPADTPLDPRLEEFLDARDIPVEMASTSVILARLAAHPGHAIIAPEESGMGQVKSIIDRLSLTPTKFDIVPPVRGVPLYGLEIGHLFGSEIMMLHPRNNLSRPGPRLLKRAVDVVLAVVLLAVLGLPMLAIAWQIRRTGAAALFRHRRVGRGGKPFYCLKFQSMLPNADKILAELLEKDPAIRREWEENFKLADDPRITPIGKFLRKTSLDELPQLFNVIKGEMSLVGPRPIVEAEIVRYGDDISYYYEVAPGVSGLWQISGRSDVDYVRRVALDTWYVKNWSLWYDLVIMLKTVPTAFSRSGAY